MTGAGSVARAVRSALRFDLDFLGGRLLAGRLRVRSEINASCETSRHELDHGDLNVCLGNFGMPFEVPCHAPVG